MQVGCGGCEKYDGSGKDMLERIMLLVRASRRKIKDGHTEQKEIVDDECAV